MINTYNQHGWVHLHNVISSDVVYELRTRAIEWRNWVKDKINQPCEYGPNYHWNGLGCAGMYDSYLMDFYTSDIMYDVSSKILENHKAMLKAEWQKGAEYGNNCI